MRTPLIPASLLALTVLAGAAQEAEQRLNPHEPFDAGTPPTWFWNGHNDATAYSAFENGTRPDPAGAVMHRDMPSKVYTESGKGFGLGCPPSAATPPWLGQIGYLQYRFKQSAFECDVDANDTAFPPSQSIEYRFRVIPSGVGEIAARHGVDYRFLRVDWGDVKPDTLHGSQVFQPDDPTEPFPSFTETIPLAAIANVPFVTICFQLRHEEGQAVEPPETFWVHLESVRLLDPAPGVPAPFELIEGMDGGVSRAISRVVILDDGDAPAPVDGVPGFNWARAPFSQAQWDDLRDVPTRVVSKTGNLCAPADPLGSPAPGGLYSWPVSLSPALHVPSELTLRPENPPLLSWDDAPCEQHASAETRAFPDVHYLIGYEDPNGALTRAEFDPLAGTYSIPLAPYATSATVWFQPIDTGDALFSAAYLRAEAVVDPWNGAILLHQGTQSLIRFLIFGD